MPRKRTPKPQNPSAEPPASTAVSAPISEEKAAPEAGFAERISERSGRNLVPDPFEIAADYVAGVHLFESRRDRQMAIKFDQKPSQTVIDKLKESSYRWNPTDQVWAHPVNRESAMGTRIDAERLYQEVRQMIREEKGISSAPEVPF